MKKRASGILLHITSLPSKYGIGDLGPAAYEFADFLAKTYQRYWQILPVNPPAFPNTHCPYYTLSAFAGNPSLISPELLYRSSLLKKADLGNIPVFPTAKADFKKAVKYKSALLDKAFNRFRTKPKNPAYKKFCAANRSWLDDYALFTALKTNLDSKAWPDWPAGLKNRKPDALKTAKIKFRQAIDKERFLQFEFYTQWTLLKKYCKKQGVSFIGDVTIYVAHDSADVWTHPDIFKLNANKKPKFVSGTPPDYYCKKGQLWGNPVYDWARLKKTGYSWWIKRFEHNLKLFDIVRIDHFRAFIAYWQVPASHKTAAKGKWIKAHAESFFGKLLKRIPKDSLICEDLGHITPNVRKFIDKHDLTRMKVMLYAFEGDPDKNPHCTHNYVRNSVVYTGTHDNNTVKGWFTKESKAVQRKKLFDFLGRSIPSSQVHWELVRLALSSPSKLAIIPVQDILGLDHRARMNRPGSLKGNWNWRLERNQIRPNTIYKLKQMTETFGRA